MTSYASTFDAAHGLVLLRPTHAEGALVYDEPVVHVEAVPVHIETYPRLLSWQLRLLVEGHWYYSTGRGWVTFRHEPEALVRYRARYYGAHPHRVHRSHEVRRPREVSHPPRRRPHRRYY
jgi:hypothetical protein